MFLANAIATKVLNLILLMVLTILISLQLYNNENVSKSIQMIFNLLIDGDAGETRRYTVDLFKDLLKMERLQKALAS